MNKEDNVNSLAHTNLPEKEKMVSFFSIPPKKINNLEYVN